MLILLNKGTHYGKFFPGEWENLLTCNYSIEIGSLFINAVWTVVKKKKNSWTNKQSPIINDDFIIVPTVQTNQSLVKSLYLCTQPSNRWLYFSAPNSTANYAPVGISRELFGDKFSCKYAARFTYKSYDKYTLRSERYIALRISFYGYLNKLDISNSYINSLNKIMKINVLGR